MSQTAKVSGWNANTRTGNEALDYNPQKQSSGSAHPVKVGLDPWNFSRQDARIRTMEEIGYHHYQGHRREGKGDIGRSD